MTWRHVAVIALAVLLVLGCGLSHVCSSSPEALHGVNQLATAIASGTLGHAAHGMGLSFGDGSKGKGDAK